MAALRKQVINGPGIEALTQTEQSASTPGEHDVVLAMHATSLNYRDLITVKTGGRGASGGFVPNSCGAGEVVAVGDRVTRVAVGDRVAPLFFQKWLAGPPTAAGLGSALGGPIDGCLRDEMVLHEDGVSPLPDYMSFDDGATLACAGLTAWRGLVEEGNLRAGQSVLVQGTGGVSIFALQFAKMFGAEVIATSSSDEKLERARALGADHTINYRETPNWAARARELTGGAGVDHIVEVGGADTLQQSIQAVALAGHVHIIGVLSGFVKDINVASIFGTNASFHGITVGSRLMFENMTRARALHRTQPVIDKTFTFEDSRAAFELMEAAGHFGKVVIRH